MLHHYASTAHILLDVWCVKIKALVYFVKINIILIIINVNYALTPLQAAILALQILFVLLARVDMVYLKPTPVHK